MALITQSISTIFDKMLLKCQSNEIFTWKLSLTCCAHSFHSVSTTIGHDFFHLFNGYFVTCNNISSNGKSVYLSPLAFAKMIIFHWVLLITKLISLDKMRRNFKCFLSSLHFLLHETMNRRVSLKKEQHKKQNSHSCR